VGKPGSVGATQGADLSEDSSNVKLRPVVKFCQGDPAHLMLGIVTPNSYERLVNSEICGRAQWLMQCAVSRRLGLTQIGSFPELDFPSCSITCAGISGTGLRIPRY
jgi:hypothetical protein